MLQAITMSTISISYTIALALQRAWHFWHFGIADRAKILVTFATEYAQSLVLLAPSLLHMNPLRVNLSIPQRTTPLDYELAYWDTRDRALAIIFGYLFFAVLGVIYLNLSTWIRGNQQSWEGRRWYC